MTIKDVALAFLEVLSGQESATWYLVLIASLALIRLLTLDVVNARENARYRKMERDAKSVRARRDEVRELVEFELEKRDK